MSVYFNPYFSKMHTWKGKPIDRDSIPRKSLEINTKSKFSIQDTVTISEQGKAAAGIEETEQAASTAKTEAAIDTGKTAQTEGILPGVDGQEAEGTMLPESMNIYYIMEPLLRSKEVIEKYYAERNEENKKFSDPVNHIWRKYWDRDYEYYEKGLTERERQDGCSQEQNAYYGLPLSVSPYDPAVIKEFGEPGFGSNAVAGLKARESMNEAINQIFKENGIVIPNGADMRLTVDPYNCLIRVSGVDEELAEKMEAALNQGKNGETLYTHIYMSDPGHGAVLGIPSSPQFSQGNPWKTSLWLAVKASTGYDLRELERKDGKFLTPDGQDVWELVADEYKVDEHYHTYRTLAIRGWDVTGDENLFIGYKDGSLYDIDTDYGYGPGQTAWVDRDREEFEKRQEEYMREREETLRREESMPNSYERAFAAARTRDGRLVSEVLYGSDAGLSSEGTVMGAQGTGWLSEGILGGNQVTLFDFMNQNRSETNLFELLKGSVSARNPEMAMKIAQMNATLRSGTESLL